ncbi:MAG TPA: translation initiation factor IF-3 [Acidobacteriota bacterium]|nr:translation initiation factor IF-3 [Acidobacteriota bacterium]
MRVNHRIRMSPVRLIGPEGEQVGILPIGEALERARERGMDLVEVAPDSRPPVCRIMDFGKYKYELAKKDKVSKKRQHALQLKEMRYRPKIDDHDYDFKTRHVREFLEAGSKVRVFVMFRGREMTHQEFGRKILNRVKEDLEDIAQVDVAPKMEGYTMSMILSPKAGLLKKIQAEKEAAKTED